MKVFNKYIFGAILCIAAFSCKKDDPDSSINYKSFGGQLIVDGKLPAFVNPGDVCDFTVSGLTLEEGDEGEISYVVSNSYTDRADTLGPDGKYSFTVPDTTFVSLVFSGRRSGYLSSSSSRSAVIVTPDSIEGLVFGDGSVTFGSNTYHTVEIGGRNWLAENIRGGVPRDEAPAAMDVFGGFFDAAGALSACPEGWKLPDADDWAALGTDAGALMSDAAYFNGERMWSFSEKVKKQDSHGFCALPAGYAVKESSGYAFRDYGIRAAFWVKASGGKAECRYILTDSPLMYALDDTPSSGFLANVRCIEVQ